MEYILQDKITSEIYEIPTNRPVSLGRDKKCDIKVSKNSSYSDYVSKEHAIIESDGLTISIRDISTNGTYVNGKQINSEEVKDLKGGDILSLSGYKFKVKRNNLIRRNLVRSLLNKLGTNS